MLIPSKQLNLSKNNIAKVFVLLFLFYSDSSLATTKLPEPYKLSYDRRPNIDTNILQSIIDSRVSEINIYNSLLYKKNKLDDSILFYRDKISELIKDTINEKKYSLSEVCLRLNSKNESILFDSLKNNFKKIINAENEIISNNNTIEESTKIASIIKNEIANKESKYQNSILEIITKTDTLTGSETIIYNNKRYLIYYVSNKKDSLQILPSPLNGAATIKSTLDNSKKPPLMITNAGMYKPNFKPQGLLISNYYKQSEVDSTKEKRDGNFYLYPNGIFYVDSSNKYFISNTSNYLKNHYPHTLIKYATQSGPLLIDDGKLNSNIKENSSNYNIRSGVGLISPDKIVFVISIDGVTFYDFKMIFTILGCKSALYLDGFVSRMYINDKYPQKANVYSDYNFGPMISIFNKK